MRLPQYSLVGKEVITLSYPQLFLGPSLASRALKRTLVQNTRVKLLPEVISARYITVTTHNN